MRDELLRSLAENSADIEKAVNEYYSSFSDTDTAEVREAELYSLLAGGKRLRPVFVFDIQRVKELYKFGSKLFLSCFHLSLSKNTCFNYKI